MVLSNLACVQSTSSPAVSWAVAAHSAMGIDPFRVVALQCTQGRYVMVGVEGGRLFRSIPYIEDGADDMGAGKDE